MWEGWEEKGKAAGDHHDQTCAGLDGDVEYRRWRAGGGDVDDMM